MAVKNSTWNTIAPIIAGILLVTICFAWVIMNKRKDDAALRNKEIEAENAATILKAKQKQEEMEREKQRALEARAAALAAQKELIRKNTLWNWVRQEGCVVSQSATRAPYHAGCAADGNCEGSLASGSVSFALPVLDRAKKTKTPAWWMADLGKERRITRVKLYNCTDSDLGKRLSNFRITILNENKKPVYDLNFFTSPGTFAEKETQIDIPDGTFGRWFRIKLNGPNAKNDGALNIAEVEVLGPPPEEGEE